MPGPCRVLSTQERSCHIRPDPICRGILRRVAQQDWTRVCAVSVPEIAVDRAGLDV